MTPVTLCVNLPFSLSALDCPCKNNTKSKCISSSTTALSFLSILLSQKGKKAQNQNTLHKYNSIYRPFSHGSLSLTFSVSLLLVKQTSPKSAQGKRETSGSSVARYCRWFSAQKLFKTLQKYKDPIAEFTLHCAA